MAEQFQTSFIPKKTFDVGPAPKTSNTSLSGILSFIAIILFVVSAVAAGGMFFYERFLIASIERKQQTLEQAKNAFEPELIRELSRLDAKFSVGGELLANHVAPSGLFDILEEATLETVRFTDLSYIVDSEGIRITMQGEARSFSSVALQSDEFAKHRSLREPVFSGLTLDERGNVDFTVTAVVDPAAVSYRERASRTGGSAFFNVEPDAGAVAGASVSVAEEPAPQTDMLTTN